MEVALSLLICLFSYILDEVNAVPPEVCFENFRWQDCGAPPVPVIYYYKSGSRCEVGMWRGCYPNPNMFKDEYECINTCIFSARVGPIDYHKLEAIEELQLDDETTTSLPTETSTGNGTGATGTGETDGTATTGTGVTQTGTDVAGAETGTGVTGAVTGGAETEATTEEKPAE